MGRRRRRKPLGGASAGRPVRERSRPRPRVPPRDCNQRATIGRVRGAVGGGLRGFRYSTRPARRVRSGQIGRASCRERVCQYVWISVVAVSLKKKKKQEKHKNEN